MELAGPVLQQGKIGLLERWWREERLSGSRELGDLVRGQDAALALAMYIASQAHDRVLACYAQLGQCDKLEKYAATHRLAVNYLQLAEDALAAGRCARPRVRQGCSPPGGRRAPVGRGPEARSGQGGPSTSFCRLLQQNGVEVGPLQTAVLVSLVEEQRDIAHRLLGSRALKEYDRKRVGAACEAAGLAMDALEHAAEAGDILRIIHNSGSMDAAWLAEFLSTRRADVILELLPALEEGLAADVAVRTARSHPELVDELVLQASDRSLDCQLAIYSPILDLPSDRLYLAYLKAAATLGRWKDIEQLARTAVFTNPQPAIELLKGLEDPLPLIILCDRQDLTEPLVGHLLSLGQGLGAPSSSTWTV